MADITEFLTAQLDEDAVLAEATTPLPVAGQWRPARDKGAAYYAPLHLVQGVHDDDEGTEYNNSSPVIAFNTMPQPYSVGNVRHIARHDPAHVLAEVAAKRRVMARHRPATGDEAGWYSHVGACIGCGLEGEFADPRTRVIDDCPELRDLAAPYAQSPGYKQKWSVK